MKKIITLLIISLISYVSAAQSDSAKFEKKHYVGLQAIGTTTFAPFYSFELKKNRSSLLLQSGLTIDLNTRPISFDFIPKIGYAFYVNNWLKLVSKTGVGIFFNPWYISNKEKYFYDCVQGDGLCPRTRTSFFIDLGLGLSFLKSKRLQFIPSYTYIIPYYKGNFGGHNKFTIEIQYWL